MGYWGVSGRHSSIEQPQVRASTRVVYLSGNGDETESRSLQSMNCCRICQSQTGSVYYAKERLIGLSEEFRYFHCLKCGCLQLDQEVENLARFYGSGYGTIHPSAVK